MRINIGERRKRQQKDNGEASKSKEQGRKIVQELVEKHYGNDAKKPLQTREEGAEFIKGLIKPVADSYEGGRQVIEQQTVHDFYGGESTGQSIIGEAAVRTQMEQVSFGAAKRITAISDNVILLSYEDSAGDALDHLIAGYAVGYICVPSSDHPIEFRGVAGISKSGEAESCWPTRSDDLSLLQKSCLLLAIYVINSAVSLRHAQKPLWNQAKK